MNPLPLGRTTITQNAREKLNPQEVLAALWVHSRGEFGDSSMLEAPENELPVPATSQVVSKHLSPSGQAFLISTKAEPLLTTVFLPFETDLSEAGLVEAWLLRSGCRSCG